MNCKHCRVEGNITKYYVCGIKNKQINEWDCKNCMLKIPDLPEGFEQIFGKGFRK